ncbi:MAG: hypothetical protein Aurels2KO_22910 [Aureliella sp.]
MDISLDDIRFLRQTLNVHRVAHEQMVARVTLLRKVSRQTRLSAIRAELELEQVENACPGESGGTGTLMNRHSA